MLNQGPRPTFGELRRTVEVNLFDFSEDIYGEWVKVEWVERIRDVQRFASPEELVRQLQRDRELAIGILERAANQSNLGRVGRA
jgi:riboflavin kinase/FMN adenylyltransferase